MNTSPIIRTEIMQQILNETREYVAIEAIQNGFTGSWERVISRQLKESHLAGSLAILDLLDYLCIPAHNLTDSVFEKVAYMITSSRLPSEELADIGID
jgi:hypothetical protein